MAQPRPGLLFEQRCGEQFPSAGPSREVMTGLAWFVIAHRWWVPTAWAVAGRRWRGMRSLLAAGGRTAVVMVYPHPVPGADAYAAALPTLQHAASILRRSGVPVAVTGQDALQSGGGGGGSGVLAETLFGGVGALVVLVLVFGSFLALMPLAIAAGSILTTFVIVWTLTGLTSVSFIAQYLLALIGLGVTIDYALLIVTR